MEKNWVICHLEGLMVSALNSGSSAPGSGALAEARPCVPEHFTLVVPLSIQVYK